MKPAGCSAVFRVDASADLGGGHVMRCLALADRLADRGWSCTFACRPGTAEAVPGLARSGYRRLTVESDREADEIGAVLDGPVDWLIVDHYERDALFEHACRAWAGRVCVLDDLADRRHDCEVLLDPTPASGPDRYVGLVPASCRLLLGPGYALLRPGFRRARERTGLAHRDGRCRRLYVSFGLTDPRGHTLLALEAIRAAGLTLPVDVVVGRISPHYDDVAAAAAAMPFPVTLHEEQADIAGLMLAADLAIGAGGGTAWERCCLGLPALVLVVAGNQDGTAAALAGAGAALVLPATERPRADLAAALRELSADGRRLAALAAAAAGLCDGLGTERAADCLSRYGSNASNRRRGAH